MPARIHAQQPSAIEVSEKDMRAVVHNGVEMAEGWPQRIEEAQRQTTYSIGGKRYDRIR
jgi:hypothetical protein